MSVILTIAQCDSQLSAERPDGTTRVEARFVHDVYEAIAPHFSATRYKVRNRPLACVAYALGCSRGHACNSSLLPSLPAPSLQTSAVATASTSV